MQQQQTNPTTVSGTSEKDEYKRQNRWRQNRLWKGSRLNSVQKKSSILNVLFNPLGARVAQGPTKLCSSITWAQFTENFTYYMYVTI